MLRPSLLLAIPFAAALLMACTAQEKKVVHELENLPGITCTTNSQNQTTCGPDSPNTASQNQ